MTSLFREEAVAFQQSTWLGGVQLLRPLSITLLTGFVITACAATVIFLTFGAYTRKAHVSGYLVPDSGIVRLMPPQTATVIERRAGEGQSVRQGDVLFVLSVDRTTLTGDTQAAVKASLAARQRSLQGASRQQADLLAAQRSALDRRIGDMRQELAQMVVEADLQRQRLVLARAAKTEYESLQASNFVSSAQVRAKAEDVLATEAQLQALARQQSTQAREISTLENERRQLPLRAEVQQGQIDRDLAALAQETAESESRQRIVIQAPQDGVLTAVLGEPGQSVSPSAALASLVPAHAQLQAQLFAPSSAVGFVRRAQTVQLRYDAYPYQKFGHHSGRVIDVSRTPLQSSELAGLPLPGALSGTALGVGTEPLYRITVALESQSVNALGQPQPLVAGMQLDADVMLERRRLIEWLFEPLLGAAGRL